MKAWAKLRPERLVPERIEILKFLDRSSVYRLVGVGLEASNVIAKCCTTKDALAERRIYEEVCPRVPVSDLRYYGLVEEPDSPSSWIFLEDAQGQPYRPDIHEHGVLAGKWLGNLHVAALKPEANLAGLDLPDRGLNHYLNLLRVGRDRIAQVVVDQPVFTHEDRRVLTTLIAQLDCLEERWNQVEESCAGLPHTFVHGNFHAGHLQIRSTKDGMSLVPMDWVHAGWGIPLIDLKLPGVNLSAYLSTVDGKLPGLDVGSVPRLLELWDVLQVVNWIYWEVSTSSEWWHSLKNMRYYETRMSERLEAIGLGPRIALSTR